MANLSCAHNAKGQKRAKKEGMIKKRKQNIVKKEKR